MQFRNLSLILIPVLSIVSAQNRNHQRHYRRNPYAVADAEAYFDDMEELYIREAEAEAEPLSLNPRHGGNVFYTMHCTGLAPSNCNSSCDCKPGYLTCENNYKYNKCKTHCACRKHEFMI